ncbi:MAG: hypothetical protein BJ554DRAFT_6167 [Olpidium bornovanus]|uniref:Uncharacterized protein n=1 Tax=Olpidium bornovanus TaxID=278681 RepID=A0A8H7ZYF2_9FUNG|nr:MAG: hypothetical protein BJ554DRAFT_6167 [Olpidium bornovanus]
MVFEKQTRSVRKQGEPLLTFRGVARSLTSAQHLGCRPRFHHSTALCHRAVVLRGKRLEDSQRVYRAFDEEAWPTEAGRW